MAESLGASAHADRTTRLTVAAWPRLLDLAHLAAYLEIGKSTVLALKAQGALPRPVPVPELIVHKGSRTTTRPGMRRLLWDREDIDQMVETWKGAA